MSKAKPRTVRQRAAEYTTSTLAAQAPDNGERIIEDGAVKFRVQGGPLDGKLLVLDVLSLVLASGPVETKYGTFAEGFVTTAEFLADLASAFRAVGATDCSPTLAYRIWLAAWERWIELKKNMQPKQK